MEEKNESWFYIIGGAAGALLGLAVAHYLVKSVDSDDKPVQINAQKGIQIGLHTINFAHGLLNLLRKT